MSPLTKLFVVLLVIVSMLNAAAIVVFVNKATPLQPALDAAKSQLAAINLQAAANLQARQQAEGQYNTEVQQHQKDNSNNQGAVAAVQGQLNEARVTIARLQSDNTDLQAGQNTANNNAQLASSTASKLQEQVTQLRTTNDKLAKENEEFGFHNAQLTSTLDSMKARLDQTQEQLSQNKEDTQKLAGALKVRGYDPDAIINTPAANDLGAPAIEGVVRETSVINGNTFVTLSVGSADGVAKGMKFYVVNGSDFLGVVTIDTVDSDNSIGKLDPARGKGDAVQKGNEVKTQLRGS